MLRKLQTIKKRSEGFTIIEVLIVLAIAALILVIVLIAIPQLQRNQRNTARKEALGRIHTELSSYSGNNNGDIPTSDAELAPFETRYLGGVNTKDPSTGNNVDVVYDTQASAAAANSNFGTPAQASGIAQYKNGYTCDGETISDASGSTRTFALWITLEGGARFCLTNR